MKLRTGVKLQVALTVISLLSLGCHNKGPDKPQIQTPRTSIGLPSLAFYGGGADGSPFLDRATLDATFDELAKAKPGRVERLSYSRVDQVESDSTWAELSKIRAPSYASAIKMLRDRGDRTPLLVSVSLIDGYLKYSNDRWYAALELALSKKIPGAAATRSDMAKSVLEASRTAGVELSGIRNALQANADIQTLDQAGLEKLWK